LGPSGTTDQNGNFNLANPVCSSAASGDGTLVYITATGGNPGLAAGTNNAALSMMSALGRCAQVANIPFVNVNEVTTVASVYALAQFITPAGGVGSFGASNTGLKNAFATVNNLVDITSGSALTTTPNGYGIVPQAELNTLADILATCVNSTGPTSANCTSLFAATTPGGGSAPADTLGAILNIALNPSNNVASLLVLAPPAAPFQPTVSAINDWTVAVGFAAGGVAPKSVAVDGTGNVWVANYGTGGTTSSLSLVTPIGSPAANSPFSNASYLNGALALAVDSSNNVWVANHDGNSAAEFNTTVSGGIPSVAPVGSALTSIGLNAPSGVAVDPTNNVWFANTGNNSLTQVPNAGCASTSCATTYTGNGLSAPTGIAIDASGNAWATNNTGGSVTRIVPGGTSGSYVGGGLTNPTGVAIDGNSYLWVTDASLGQLSLLNNNGAPLSPNAGLTGGGVTGSNSVAIDGNGAVWVADSGANQISQLNSAGTPITGATGLQGGGLSSPAALTIDASGNIWVANANPATVAGKVITLTEFVGTASPAIAPLAQAVLNGQLGQEPGTAILHKPPVAVAGGPYTGIAGTALSFSGAASTDPKDQPLTYAWTFSDGGGGSGARPSHSFFAPGTYTATLTVTNTDGKQSSASTNVIVGAAPSLAPVATAGGPYSGTTYTTVPFSGLSSSDPANPPLGATGLTYSWNFGDGGHANGPTPVHTYTTTGTFPITLTVQSTTTGLTANATSSAVIAAGVNAAGTPTANPGGPYSVAANSPVTLSSAGSSDPNNLALSYIWAFGDGSSSTLPNPTHTYTTAGSYSPVLTVSNGTAQSSASAVVSVTGTPLAAMVANAGGPYTVAVNQPVTMNGTGTTNPSGRQLLYAWDFGDGTTGGGATPIHFYTKSGSYTVNLSVNDGATLSASAAAKVTVTGPATEAITASIGGPYQDVTGQTITFDASNSVDNLSNPLTYAWDFGDGSTGAGATPTHVYTAVGNYTATLKVSSTTASATATTTVPVSAAIAVTITSPTANTLFGTNTVTVTGTANAPNLSVMVNGTAASVSGNNFTAASVSLREGVNLITATATDGHGGIGSGVVSVILDVTAPRVSITSPASGATVTSSAISVAGLVNDSVTGTIGSNNVTVTVNGLPAQVANRSYLLPSLQLVPGLNTITVVATDNVGNVGKTTQNVTLLPATSQLSLVKLGGDSQTGAVKSVLGTPLTVQLVSASGSPVAGRPVTFTVTRSDGMVEVLPTIAQAIAVTTDANGKASVLFQLGSRSGLGINQVSATTPGAGGAALFTETSTTSAPTQIFAVTGENQRGLLGEPLAQAFQVIVEDAYGNPVPGVTVNYTAVGATDGTLDNAAPLTDINGKAIANLTLGQQEGTGNYAVAADFAGDMGNPATFIASAYAPGPISNTSVSGTVLDNSQIPVPNATVTISGTGLSTVTNASGNFTISGAPVGTVTLTVDGSTATTTETLPFLSFVLQDLPGVNNSLGKPIYLPAIDVNDAQTVGASDPVTLTMAGVPGLAFTVAPNSVTFPDGSTVGKLSLSQVKSDLVPMEPSNGTHPNVVWTLQPAGTKFSVPVQLTVPNTQGMAPGTVTEIFQYDHDLEQFVSVGTGHVSADGSVINSDPGFGITKAGWSHCCTPQVAHGQGISCVTSNICYKPVIKNGVCQKIRNDYAVCKGNTAAAQQCQKQGLCYNGKCSGKPLPDGSPCNDNLFCTDDQCVSGVCKSTPIADAPAPNVPGGGASALAIQASFAQIGANLNSFTSAIHIPLMIQPTWSATSMTKLVCCEVQQTKNVPIEKDQMTGGIDITSGQIIPVIGGVPLGVDLPIVGLQGISVQFGGNIGGQITYTDDQCLMKKCAEGGPTLSIGGSGSITFGAAIAASFQGTVSTGFSGGVTVGCDQLTSNITWSGIKLTGSMIFGYFTFPVNYQAVNPIALVEAKIPY
jgi:PKD repeat protein/sugar lactone lactonase YvrE